jgi:nucleotidyltransferase substrate binding protein (TIGR01987 family)
LENLERAHRQLCKFLSSPIEDERDRAGVVQAFEFTFELFWKTMQKLAAKQSLPAASPRAALQAGLGMALISLEKQETWAAMLRDRNLTSHTYNEDLANEIFHRIVGQYVACFAETLEKMRAYA